MICAVGHRASLVGISHECDFPDGVRGLTVVTRARLSGAKTSGEIDGDVRGLLQSALAIYEIELARLEALRPDVIVTQDLCEVCAVSFDDVRAAVARLARKDVRVVNLHPMRLGDVWGDIGRVASALDAAAEGERVVAALGARVSAIARRASALAERPRVLTVEWIEPVMIGGLWMPELVELAGGVPLVTSAGQHAPALSHDALVELAPDVVVIKPCGFALSRTLEETDALRASLPWAHWAAQRDVRAYVADGNAFFNRPGPRIVESLEILAACQHPHVFADFSRAHAGSFVAFDFDSR
jgi:iron complex transport system substrate-binding protein